MPPSNPHSKMRAKTLIIFQVLILTFFTGIGQFDSTSIAVIKNIIEDKQDTAKIYYVDSIIYFKKVKDFTRMLSKGKFSWNFDGRNNREIEITNGEKKQILEELKRLKHQIWGTNLFPNSIRIPADSFMRNAISINSSHASAKNRIYKYAWQFCKPIFLRNNSIAIVQYIYLCGQQCGEEEVSFYKNIDGHWKRWIRVSGSVF
jgi:hypothetical protein